MRHWSVIKSQWFLLNPRYLVTHLMGADLNNIVKCQKLTDDHVQFLIYQILRGLKVSFSSLIWRSHCRSVNHTHVISSQAFKRKVCS